MVSRWGSVTRPCDFTRDAAVKSATRTAEGGFAPSSFSPPPSSLPPTTCNKWMCGMCKMKKDVAPPVYTRRPSERLCSGAGKDGADFTPTRVVFSFPDANNNLASSPNCNIDRKHPLFLVLETSNGWLPLVCTTIWNKVLSSQPPWKHSFTLFFFKRNNNIDQLMEFLWNSTTNSPSVVIVFILWAAIFQSPQLIS